MTITARRMFGAAPRPQPAGNYKKEVIMSCEMRLAALVRRLSLMVVAVLVIATFASSTAQAQTVTYSNGCYVCKKTGMFVNDCMDPPNNGWGNTKCTLWVILFNTVCSTDGDMCMYICVGDCNSGGGGTGGGGSGGSSCDTSGGWCPPDCFSCGGQLY